MSTRELSLIGLLSACGVGIYVFESLIPMPLPWLKVGLSNVAVVIALFAFGIRQALIVNFVRIVAGNLMLGLLLNPGLVLSASGSTASVIGMWLLKSRLIPPFSVVGASAIGGAISNVVQVIVFLMLFSSTLIIHNMLGIFLIAGATVGTITGTISANLIPKLRLETDSMLN